MLFLIFLSILNQVLEWGEEHKLGYRSRAALSFIYLILLRDTYKLPRRSVLCRSSERNKLSPRKIARRQSISGARWKCWECRVCLVASRLATGFGRVPVLSSIGESGEIWKRGPTPVPGPAVCIFCGEAAKLTC